jgi:hypothetical protein
MLEDPALRKKPHAQCLILQVYENQGQRGEGLV